MSLRTLLTTLLVSCSFSVMAATEIVPLNYHTSADMLPVAQDFIGKEGQVSAYGSQLIVNADQRKIDELKALLSQLDTAPKRLLITVDTNENNFQGDQGYTVNGVKPSQTRIINRSTDSRDGGIQQIQATDGMPALIQVGQSVPITSSQSDSYGGYSSQTQYRNVTQGFYVTATVTGEIVRLSISTNRDRMSQERPDVVNVQSTDTTITGHLGEWILLAGVNGQTQADKQGLARSYSTQSRNDITLRVKVDTLD
ncbi:secretin N-terminal domain-containing protein [Pseudomonas izuensis]|uniref:Type II and III secretion system family protein n=1 Tax=Pseudomonas izuensis TaxID=2684212 RepID=A0ABM7S2W0_9PSED|nr:secretin N-terminal domain-containing protein [Pseudomonas izuensis]BCX69298.1 type II and III secretion system family protein [Pseudomonas izuensis]